MIGISQLQFPSSDSSKLKFAGYFATFVSLSILTNPVNVLFSLGAIFFRSEIKTFYIYKEIKAAKQQKISKKEYWEIFFKNNKIKLLSFSLFSAFITYLTFTTTFLLVSLLGTIPLTMLLILLQSELRPKDFNPFTLLKAAINFFLEGIKENSRAMVNRLDNAYEHLLPHQLNEDINENINKLKDKYSKKIPDDIINNTEFKQFIDYIDNSEKFSDANKGMIITFLNEFCSNDQMHSSDLTGGQILLLVLRACNDGDNESVKNKKDALITNLIDTQTFSRKERIPNTCFTGVIYRMLSTLEVIHPDPEITFTPPVQILLSEAESNARRFMLGRLKEKRNNKEVFNAWYKVQSDPEDSNSQKIVDEFIAEISIPLMRKLFGWTSQYTEQAVLTLMKNVDSIKLNLLQKELRAHIGVKLISLGLNNESGLFENIKEKVFLELLNKDLLKADLSLKDSSRDEAERIADKIIEEEVKEFKLKADEKIKRVSPIEDQVNRTLENLSTFPQKKKCCIAYRTLCNQYEGHDKEIMENFLLKKLEVTKKEMDNILEENDTLKLKLALDEACRKSGKSMAEMIKETEALITSHFLNKVSVENVETGLSR